jgi:hypothetical protein
MAKSRIFGTAMRLKVPVESEASGASGTASSNETGGSSVSVSATSADASGPSTETVLAVDGLLVAINEGTITKKLLKQLGFTTADSIKPKSVKLGKLATVSFLWLPGCVCVVCMAQS